jgi:AcrR family transcriptional regulator
MPKPGRLPRSPIRADARRNYDALVAAAGEVFTERGTDAPLDVIARRAGVGNATLYRHFPTRRDLLVAVSADDVEALCALADRLRSGPDPRAALVEWLRAYIDHVSTRSGLAAAFNTGRHEDSALIKTAHDAVEAASAPLLERARQAGEVRADLRMDDLLALANAIATAAETGDRERTSRLLRLILEGITADESREPRAEAGPF